MKKLILVTKKIKKFNNKITVEGDKSLSIRFALLASQASGKSTAYNLLRSDDVISTLNCLKKLGVKIKFKNNCCEIHGNGINSFKYKRNLVLNLGNSGTLGRLLLALLIRSPYKIKLIGDQSLSKRNFSRVILPLRKFGANFYPKNKKTLPIHIKGTNFLRPIEYFEKRASAQVKSCIMLGALNSPGITRIIAKKSRNHTEILFKYLKIPISVRKTKNFDFIKVNGKKNFTSFNYNIPSDISSSAFFIVLTLLSNNSSLTIRNVNINSSRIGSIYILNKMGATRSGLALKQGLTLANNVGIIDSDYVEPVFAMITNISGNTQYIKHNERICQGELFKDQLCILEEISEPPERKTDRDGGFGSTGRE